jgi:murein DD-endopeptidase MepM/ murein hydrolase activator NlpD
VTVRPLAVVLAALALAATTARASVFAVVPATSPTPNAAVLPMLATAWTTPPATPVVLDYSQLLSLWQGAGSEYGIPWQVLAAINKVETNFGRNMGPSSAGAIGWMQFMPSTWLRWGTDGDGDGVADPWNPADAIYSAARYLAAAGGGTDLYRAVYAYNHADWYVREVLSLAQVYAQGRLATTSFDEVQANLQQARERVASVNEQLVAARATERQRASVEAHWRHRADAARLLSTRLAYGKQAGLAGARRADASARVAELEQELSSAQQALSQSRTAAAPASFAPGTAPLLGAPAYSNGYVFPVGGGPGRVSVAHTHHDYPAADIAAPYGSPVYALADAVVTRAWHSPDGNCGIGFSLTTADGLSWTYCHLAYEEPAVQAGTDLSAGQPVGLVGATGDATGPHLHLQLNPATSYPQELPWFQSFAGTAFSWQDAATPSPPLASLTAAESPLSPVRSLQVVAGGVAAFTPAAPVFRVLPTPQQNVVFFSR